MSTPAVLPEQFRTRRLTCERLASVHRADLSRLHTDVDVMRELGGERSEEETDAYLKRNLAHWERFGFGVWMVAPHESRYPIGRVVLRWLDLGDSEEVEIGFALMPEFWGRGYATEAGAHCLELARAELGCRSVVGVTTPANVASQSVLRKLGLSYVSDVTLEQTVCALYRVRW